MRRQTNIVKRDLNLYANRVGDDDNMNIRESDKHAIRYKKSKTDAFFSSTDLFAGQVPGFKFNGSTSIGSLVGFICSIFAVAIILPYAIVKMIRVVKQRDSPTISNYINKSVYAGNAHPVDLKKLKRKPAFVAKDFFEQRILDNPKYVEWKAHMVETKGAADGEIKTEIGLHICTEAEWLDFYAPEPTKKQTFDRLKASNQVKCLDDKDVNGVEVDYNIYGDDENQPHRRLDVTFAPCTKRTKENRCVMNLATSIRYIGAPDI